MASMYDKLRLINHHWPHPAATNPWYNPPHPSGAPQTHAMHPNGFSTAAAAAVLSAASMGAGLPGMCIMIYDSCMFCMIV